MFFSGAEWDNTTMYIHLLFNYYNNPIFKWSKQISENVCKKWRFRKFIKNQEKRIDKKLVDSNSLWNQ